MNGKFDKNDLIKPLETADLIKYLNDIINFEIQKSDSDADIIKECTDWLCELQGIKSELSEEEIKRRVSTIIVQCHPKKKRFISNI